MYINVYWLRDDPELYVHKNNSGCIPVFDTIDEAYAAKSKLEDCVYYDLIEEVRVISLEGKQK